MHLSPTPRSLLLVPTPPASAGMRIGLMGGSFNPPHAGHLQVAQTAMRRLRLDSIWWLVSPGNPLKANDALPSLADRIAQCRTLTRNDRRIVITDVEAELSTVYTADTVATLTRRYPAVHFVWVMGADNLANFHRWRRWHDIARALPIAVVDRPGWHLAALASTAAGALARYRIAESRAAALPQTKPPAWTYLAARLSPISSTALRATRPERSSQAATL